MDRLKDFYTAQSHGRQSSVRSAPRLRNPLQDAKTPDTYNTAVL